MTDLPLQNPVDLNRMRAYRLSRIRAELKRRDISAAILTGPQNLRYATDARNMSVWTLFNMARYCFVPVEGPVVLFEFDGAQHVTQGLPTVDETRPATNLTAFLAGDRIEESARAWANELADLVRTSSDSRRVALDRCIPAAMVALQDTGLDVVEGQGMMEVARSIKSPDEVECMRQSIGVAEIALQRIQDAIVPGVTENALWAILNQVNAEYGGEWIETRLLNSGERTVPWYQEAGERRIQPGDMVCLDTDMIGPYGYLADISRSFICDGAAPSGDQKRLYRLACEQLEENMALIRPGLSFRELSEGCWTMPKNLYKNRYLCVIHGVGLADEYPNVPYIDDFMYDGNLEANMTVSVESYLGDTELGVGVKLENQLIITETGCEMLSTFPYDDRLLGYEI